MKPDFEEGDGFGRENAAFKSAGLAERKAREDD